MKRYVGLALGLLLLLGVGGVMVVHQRANDQSVKPTYKPTEGSYVALGDSVSAGLGLKTASDWRYCGQTDESYPHAVATQANLTLQDYSCRDAKTTTGLLQPQLSNGQTLQAQQTQLFAMGQTPKLVSLTMGANDIEWTQLLQQCYVATCGTAADTGRAQAAVAMVGQNLTAFLSNVKAHYATPPTTVVTGYYDIFPAQAVSGCYETSRLDAAELSWWRGQQAALDQAIQTAAADSGFARYAAIKFAGHELCSSQPWVQDITAPAPLHPTAEGEAAMAQAVLAARR